MGKDTPKSIGQGEIQRMIDQQTALARPNQITPVGSMTWKGNTVTTTLSPAQQQLLEQLELVQLLGGQRAEEMFGGINAGRAGVEQAVFDRAMGLLGPELARREEALRVRLANQGLPQSSRAFRSELGRFEDTSNRAREEAALASVIAGGNEESRIIQNILALATGTQPAAQQFFAPGAVDVLGAYGLAANANQARYNTQAQLQGQIIGGLLGAGGRIGAEAVPLIF